MKQLMGIQANENSKMQGLANKVADRICETLANGMNDVVVSVSEHLPRLNVDNEVCAVEAGLPDECIISTLLYKPPLKLSVMLSQTRRQGLTNSCLGIERPCSHTCSSVDCYL